MAVPAAPYSIEGTVRIAGTITTDKTITIENLTAGGIGYSFLDDEGHYFYDDIQDRDVGASAGDTIRVSVTDTEYIDFTVADEPEERVVDFDYILHPHPVTPYSIEGTVRYYGIVQYDSPVVIYNVTKGASVTCRTDTSGHYFYDDINDDVIQSEPGDIIHVSTSDGAGSTFIALDTEEKVVDFLDIVMWGASWKIRITPTAGTPYTDSENEVGELGSYTFQNDDGILSGITLSFQNNGMASFDIALINENGIYNDIFAIGNLIEIWMDSELGLLGTTKRLTGTIKTIMHDVYGGDGIGNPAKNVLILKGFDYIGVFKQILVNELYRGKRTYEGIIKDSDGLLELYAPEINGSGVQKTGKILANTETILFSHISLFECITRLLENVGDWIIEITPDGVLKCEPKGINDNGRWLVEFDNPGFEYDDSNMANCVVVYGGQISNLQNKTGWIGTASNNESNAWRAFDKRL